MFVGRLGFRHWGLWRWVYGFGCQQALFFVVLKTACRCFNYGFCDGGAMWDIFSAGCGVLGVEFALLF